MSDKWIKLTEQSAEDTRLLRARQEAEMVNLLTQQTTEIDALRIEITRLTEALRKEWVADQCAAQDRIEQAVKELKFHGEWTQPRRTDK